MLRVIAPVAGTVVAMSEVPDPVFAGEIVGPGLAIDPGDAPESVALAPISGTIAKLHAHACVIQAASGQAVLMHLGLDTVQLAGEGFTLHAADGDVVEAGQPLVTWTPSDVTASGRSVFTPVVALEASAAAITRTVEPGAEVSAGDPLFDWA